MFRRSRLLVMLVLSLAAPAAAGAGSDDSAPTLAVGGLSEDAVREIVYANRYQVRSCFEGLLDRFPTLEGKVVIRFIISANGSVSESSVDSSTVNNAELEACVVERVQRWVFPKPKGGVDATIRSPFIFGQSPADGSDDGAPTSAVRGLSKDALLQVIHANRSQVRSCYEGLLDRFPTLEGKVVIRFIISADGSASESSVDSSTVNNAELEACVVERVRRWAFPKPGGGIRVTFRYPYIFRLSPDPRARAAAPSRRDPSGLSGGLGFGYAAPLGSLAQANSGGTEPLSGEFYGQFPVVLEAGYRFARHFTAGVYMQVGYPLLVTTGQGLAATECHLPGVASCHGNAVLRVGVQLSFSFTPDATLQPWVGVGAGYEKAIYILENGHGGSLAIGYAGWEPLNLQLGLDIQALPVVAWGPYVAGSLGQYSTIDFDNSLSGVAPITIDTPRLHGWLQLGLRVRFGS